MSDAGRFTEEDLALIRLLGSRISQLIHGEDVDVPDLQRRDELGILANMVSRLARELHVARRQDSQVHAELEHRIAQLQGAYSTQEKLLATIRDMSSPILDVHEGVLLVPIVGTLDAARVGHVMPALLERVAATRPNVVIIHVNGLENASPEAATLLLRAGQSARQFGARAILSGVPHDAKVGGVDFTALTPCSDLREALSTALDVIGYRITR
jgi:rsbT co-antagonist protein RsbR